MADIAGPEVEASEQHRQSRSDQVEHLTSTFDKAPYHVV
jgi:hypothetical protein